MRELRQAARAILRRWKLTVAMVAIQAVAIAAATTAFGVVGVVVLVPSVVGNIERLGWVFGIDSREPMIAPPFQRQTSWTSRPGHSPSRSSPPGPGEPSR